LSALLSPFLIFLISFLTDIISLSIFLILSIRSSLIVSSSISLLKCLFLALGIKKITFLFMFNKLRFQFSNLLFFVSFFLEYINHYIHLHLSTIFNHLIQPFLLFLS